MREFRTSGSVGAAGKQLPAATRRGKRGQGKKGTGKRGQIYFLDLNA